MLQKNNMQNILQNLTTLTQNYMSTYRWNINYEKYKRFAELMWDDIDFDIERVRESLICHVGHLPIIASYLHPYIDHTDEVDLGRVLQMLAIHDIWETIVGDVITVAADRSTAEQDAEDAAARSLLNDKQYELYMEYSDPKTLDGKFTKSIDKISTKIMMCASDINIEKARYKHFWFTLDDWSKYHKYMERDNFLKEFFEYTVQEIHSRWSKDYF